MKAVLIHLFSAFFTTIGFSIIFNVRARHLIHCGIVGTVGWAVYALGDTLGYSVVLFTFLATMAVSLCAYGLAKYKRCPITVFLIPGIIPLVPGLALYRTMYHLLFERYTEAIKQAILTIQIAGVIALGIVTVALIPAFFKSSTK